MRPATHKILIAQRGIISRNQAIASGMTPDQIKHLLAKSDWCTIFRSIYRLATVVMDHDRWLRATLVWGEGKAVVSHRSAACIWGFGTEPALAEITTTRQPRWPGAPVKVHRVPSLPAFIRKKDGIILTDPTETLINLAGVLNGHSFEDALDEALRLRLTSLPTLCRRLEATGGGSAGTVRLRRALGERADGRSTQSRLERKLLAWLKEEGLPTPVRQYVINDEQGNFVARPDFVYPQARLAIEAESFRHHSGPAWDKDMDRLNGFVGTNFDVLHVTNRQIDRRDRRVIEKIRKRLGQEL